MTRQKMNEHRSTVNADDGSCYDAPMSRVKIGTCAGPADAALVRAMFAAHDLPVVIGGEQHASMMGGLAGAFVSLDILVDDADADEATALLEDLRRSEPAEPDADDSDDDDDDLDARPEPAGMLSIEARVDRRRRTGIALLLGFCVTFGTAHMFTRAWLRGVLLGGLEIFAFTRLMRAPLEGALLCAAAILTDAIGAVVRVRRAPAPGLPRARLARG
jgi:hypothetical protein